MMGKMELKTNQEAKPQISRVVHREDHQMGWAEGGKLQEIV